MTWLRNLPIARKFLLAFGIVCGLCIVLGAFTVFTFRDIAVKNADVSANSLPALVALSDARGALLGGQAGAEFVNEDVRAGW